MKPYTVVGLWESGQSFMEHTEGKDAFDAFYRVAQKYIEGPTDLALICALPGHLEEGEQIHFSGESAVYTEDIVSPEGPFHPDNNTN